MKPRVSINKMAARSFHAGGRVGRVWVGTCGRRRWLAFAQALVAQAPVAQAPVAQTLVARNRFGILYPPGRGAIRLAGAGRRCAGRHHVGRQ